MQFNNELSANICLSNLKTKKYFKSIMTKFTYLKFLTEDPDIIISFEAHRE